MSPEHPNLLRGSSVPVDVEIERYDGFDGPVGVRLEGLPPGFTAAPAVIAAGSDNATMILAAAPDAATSSPPAPGPIRLVGSAGIAGNEVVRTVEPENGVRLLTVLPDPDIRVTTDVRQVMLTPGGTAEVVAQVDRRNGFKGRVPIEVRNLPFGVQVRDVGLNGVLDHRTADKPAVRDCGGALGEAAVEAVLRGGAGGVAAIDRDSVRTGDADHRAGGQIGRPVGDSRWGWWNAPIKGCSSGSP